MTSTSTATRGGFRLLLAAIVVSGFGTSAMWLAAGIWVKDLTGSDSLAALCAFALWAPALAGPLLGTVADRTRRRPLLVAVNLGLGLLLLSLMAVDSAGSLWILFAVLVAYGACGVVTDAAEAALVPAVVGRQSLGDFNGLRTTADEGMKLVAPLAGAGLFAVYGGAGVALLDAATFAAAAGLYARLRVRESVPDRRAAGVWFRTAEGVRALWRQERLRPLVLAAAATMLLAGLNGAALYAVVDGGLGRSPRTRASCTPCRAPVRSWPGSPRVGCCGGSASAGSRRRASPCSRWARACVRCRTTRWRSGAAPRSAWACPAC